jgi:hypothetical protein
MIKTRRRSSSSARQARHDNIRAQKAAKRARDAERVNILPAALRMEEARVYLGGLSVMTMHSLIQRGLLRPNRTTRHLLFPREELDRLLREGMTNE